MSVAGSGAVTVSDEAGTVGAGVERRQGRYRLFAVLGGLYLAQAIPSYLFVAALPPIMREMGVSRTAIGYMSILLLPLVIKFLWAPWIDRIRPFARAHRAGWVFITQSLTILAILALLAVGPTEVGAIIAIGFIASLLISTQDIATDGYAAKYLPEEDRAIGNAIQTITPDGTSNGTPNDTNAPSTGGNSTNGGAGAQEPGGQGAGSGYKDAERNDLNRLIQGSE